MSDLLKSIYNTDSHTLIPQPKVQTYFDIFGVTDQLHFDIKQIEETYYFLSKYIHPDLFNQKSEEQKALSIRYSELLNNGLKTFRNPFKKATYWLEIHHLTDRRNNSVPPEVMADVFEIQEMLSEQELSEDQREELEEFLERFETLEKQLKQTLLTYFSAWDTGEFSSKKTLAEQLNAVLNKHSYVAKLIEQMNEKLEEND